MQQVRKVLAKLLPASFVGCGHGLATWVTRAAKSTAVYDDGNPRPDGHRGGRLVRSVAPCVFTPDHPGGHRTEDGRSWT
jgi:hypothetical protein